MPHPLGHPGTLDNDTPVSSVGPDPAYKLVRYHPATTVSKTKAPANQPGAVPAAPTSTINNLSSGPPSHTAPGCRTRGVPSRQWNRRMLFKASGTSCSVRASVRWLHVATVASSSCKLIHSSPRAGTARAAGEAGRRRTLTLARCWVDHAGKYAAAASAHKEMLGRPSPPDDLEFSSLDDAGPGPHMEAACR